MGSRPAEENEDRLAPAWPSAPEERAKIAQGRVRVADENPGNAPHHRCRPVGSDEIQEDFSKDRKTAMSAKSPNVIVDLSFPHLWQAEILAARPLILPPRHFVYPRAAEEVERGALEVMIRPEAPQAQPFLATCALGFRDSAAPTGLWSTPQPEEICAVAGGYAYIIDTAAPQRFTMIAYRPVLEVRTVVAGALLLFVGHHAILAWGPSGLAWESAKLSDEGVTILGIEDDILRGTGWEMRSDREKPFALDLQTGSLLPSQAG